MEFEVKDDGKIVLKRSLTLENKEELVNQYARIVINERVIPNAIKNLKSNIENINNQIEMAELELKNSGELKAELEAAAKSIGMDLQGELDKKLGSQKGAEDITPKAE